MVNLLSINDFRQDWSLIAKLLRNFYLPVEGFCIAGVIAVNEFLIYVAPKKFEVYFLLFFTTDGSNDQD